MPNEFWAEAVQCAIYVQNQCPQIKLVNQTPQEAYCDHKPNVSYLKVLGSVAYVHVPIEKEQNLMIKVRNMCSLGMTRRQRLLSCLIQLTKG